MKCSGSNRLGAASALFALALSTCAFGLDFDELSNECLAPRFDIPALDTYCSGLLVAGTTYRPPDLDFEGAETVFLAVTAEADWIATAALSITQDEEGCFLVIPGLNLAHLEPDGTITSFASLSGVEVGIIYRLDDGTATCTGNARYVWPTELSILDADPYVHVAAAFGDGGLWDVWFDAADVDQNPATRFASIRHLAGDPRGPTRRACMAGACTTRLDQLCVDSNECGPDAYCDSDTITCRPLAPCRASSGGCGDGLVCAGRRDTCTVQCSSDADCAHPLTCSIDGRCGGQGCGVANACLLPGQSCVNGACLTTCTGESQCDDGLFCFADDDLGVCATGGQIGACEVDTDCALETAYGFAEAPGNAITSNFTSLLIATQSYLRTAAYITGRLAPYLFAPSEDAEFGDAVNTDVIYLADTGALYLSIDTGVILRIDWDDLTLGAAASADFEDYARLYPIELDPGAQLVALRRVGGYLVTIEGPLGSLGTTASFYSRALQISADPDTDLVPAFEGALSLGASNRVTVGVFTEAPDLWFFGLNRDRGGELLFYDMRDPAQPILSGALPIGDIEAGEPEFVNVTSAGIFAASAAGVTPYTISVEEASP